MSSKVFFTDFKIREARSVLQKIDALFEKAGLGKIFQEGDLVALKTHFGTFGSTRQLRSTMLRRVVENVIKNGGNPFLTETTGLQHWKRWHANYVLQVAEYNGITYETIGAPIVCADGMKGVDCVEVPIEGLRLKKVYVASAIANSNAMISIAHVKIHGFTGIAGALKNVGIGCVSKQGKAYAHMIHSYPLYEPEKCTGCGHCIRWCPMQTIVMEDGKAIIEWNKCISCLICTTICKEYNKDDPAIKTPTERFAAGEPLLKGFIDNVAGVVKRIGKEHIGYMNFIIEVTPHCDCTNYSDIPIIPDIGILASMDPVAIDKASIDLVNASPGIASSSLSDLNEPGALKPGFDKVKALSKVEWSRPLQYAENLGLGTMDYELVRLDV